MKMFTRTRDRAGTNEFEATLDVIHAKMQQIWPRFVNLSEEGRIKAAGHDSGALTEVPNGWVVLSAVMTSAELKTKHQMMYREIDAKARILASYHHRTLAS